MLWMTLPFVWLSTDLCQFLDVFILSLYSFEFSLNLILRYLIQLTPCSVWYLNDNHSAHTIVAWGLSSSSSSSAEFRVFDVDVVVVVLSLSFSFPSLLLLCLRPCVRFRVRVCVFSQCFHFSSLSHLITQ